MLRILKDSNHSEYEDVVDWIGDEFDPKVVDIDEFNERLGNGFST
jgi:hypothetical protein